MTLRYILQSWYNQEIKTLSDLAEQVVYYYFPDYTQLLSIYNQGQSALNSYSTLFPVKKEIWELAERLHKRFVNEKLYELQKIAMRDITDKGGIERQKIMDGDLNDIYLFFLSEESPFVKNTLKTNCPDYHDALPFVTGKKSVHEFLRCTERQRNQLQTFFKKFGDVYNKFNNDSPQPEQVKIKDESKEILSATSWTKQLEQSIKNKVKGTTKANKIAKHDRAQKGILDLIHEEEKVKKSRKKENKSKKEEVETQYKGPVYNISDLYRQSFYYSQVQSPTLYDTPSFIIDDFHMMISINYGCNGVTSLGLQSNYVEPPIGNILYNFERFHAKYNPDEIYQKTVVSDKIARYSHGYRWFGVKGHNYLESLNCYGIAALCTNLYFGEYICYVPVLSDDEDDETYVVKINISDDVLVSLLTKRRELPDFLTRNGIDLREFKLLEITDKLLYLSRYFDLYEFLGLDKEELESKADIALRLQAIMAKKTTDQFVWDSFSIEEKNDYLQQKTKAYNNKSAFLWFNIVRTRYIPYSKEIEISYLIRSEYSIEVYIDIDIEYKDGTIESYSHIEVQPYDNNFEFFQGRTKFCCTQDYMNITLIELHCSDC